MSAGGGNVPSPVDDDRRPITKLRSRTLKSRRLHAVLASVILSTVGFLVASSVPAGATTTTPPDTWTSAYSGVGNPGTNESEHVITAATASRLKPAWVADQNTEAVAPAIVDGVVYRIVNPGNVHEHGNLQALSVRTGAKLWSVTLPANRSYYYGETVVNQMVLLPFAGYTMLNGITAVDMNTHKIAWNRTRPRSRTNPGNDDGTSNPLVVNRGRAYVYGNTVLSAFNVYTGAIVWRREVTGYIQGIAASGDRVFTAGFHGSNPPAGLNVYNGESGALEWTAPNAYHDPVVVGSRVIVPNDERVSAFATAGCGQPTCAPLWTTKIGNAYPPWLSIGGADAHTLFVDGPSEGSTPLTTLQRLSTTTGKLQWQVTLPDSYSAVPPIRAGNVVWETVDPHQTETLMGWSVTATTATPVASIQVQPHDNGDDGSLSAADGTLIVSNLNSSMTAYRIPGT
ncbi:MAG: PQQ-binding-like beta-propeller repeat protein [Nakamurella sp.]